MTKAIFIIMAVVICLPVMVLARMSSTNYIITTDSFDAGGDQATSTNYLIKDAFGEIAIGSSTSTNFKELEFIASYLFRVLSITAPTSTSLIGKTVSAASQTATGTIDGIEITDDGTAGWSVTLTSQHLTATSTVKVLSGSNSTVDFTGTYDGLDGVLDPNGTFIVEIVETGGVVGTAVFQFTDPAGSVSATNTTASSVVLSNGISATFDAATYIIGDKWSMGVDVFPYTGLTVTPGTITVVGGDTVGVTAGSSEVLAGTGATSDAKSLMTGDSNNSTGTYQQDEGLELNIHANSLSGSFQGTVTLTVL